MNTTIPYCWIIDDDPLFIYGTKRILRENHFFKKVEVYNNGEDALHRLSEIVHHKLELPNVILLDLNMPIMTGWDFLARYKKLMPKNVHSQLYVLSSYIVPKDLAKIKGHSHVKDYISKPITPDDLEYILDGAAT